MFGRTRHSVGDNAVRAQALVIAGDSGISGTTSWLSLARLRVTIPDRPPIAVTHECMVDRGKELVEGFTVPVMVDPSDPNKLEILWDEVPSIQERIANRDPAILDPEVTWETLRAPQFAKLAPSVPRPVSPWAEKAIADWPPVEPLAKGRQPGTAWVVASSMDARLCTGTDSSMPPGRTHYRSKGPVSYGPHSFMTWLLLRVNPQYGTPYGAHFRTNAVRWRFSAVLPVALNPDDPTDIEICWDAATNVAELYAEKINTSVAATHDRVEQMTAFGHDATVQTLANIADPAARQAAADNLQRMGMIDANAAAAVAATPVPGALERLESLRSSGILSDAEFETERAKLASET
jgi:hypothetical protein